MTLLTRVTASSAGCFQAIAQLGGLACQFSALGLSCWRITTPSVAIKNGWVYHWFCQYLTSFKLVTGWVNPWLRLNPHWLSCSSCCCMVKSELGQSHT